MNDPESVIQDWYSLLKPGGYFVVIVPDEDLYEQGSFPSVFNPDHKFTFTLSKSKSWSPRSINILDLVKKLDGQLITAELQDYRCERSMIASTQKMNRLQKSVGRRLGKIAMKLSKKLPQFERRIVKFFSHAGGIIDQTNLSDVRLAQILIIVRKN